MINWRHIKDDIEKNMFLEENNIEENEIILDENEEENEIILDENEEENEDENPDSFRIQNLIEENKNLMLEIERLQNDKFEKIVLIVVSIIFTIITILKTN